MKPIPSLIDLRTKLSSDIRISFGLEEDSQKEFIDAMSAVLAAQFKSLYLYSADNRSNLYPDTADLAEDGGELERLGVIYLNRQPKPATEGKYLISLTGDSGSFVRNSLTFKSNSDSNSPGNLYVFDEEYTLTGTGDQIVVRSLNPGLDFLLKVGDKLSVTEPVIGLNQEVEVLSVDTAPLSAEDISVYRRFILDAIQLEAQGGARTDYRLWASDAQGVRLVYPYLKESASGTVQIFVEATKLDSVDGKGTPSSSLLEEVEQVFYFDPDETIPIDLRGRVPIQAHLEVLPISLVPVDLTILGLTDSSSEILESIRLNIDKYLESIRPFVFGAELLRDKRDILLNAKLSSIASDVIGNINYFTDFKMFVDGNEVNIFTFSGSSIPYFRNLNLS